MSRRGVLALGVAALAATGLAASWSCSSPGAPQDQPLPADGGTAESGHDGQQPEAAPQDAESEDGGLADAKPVVGDALLHPAAIVSVIILLLNDHLLKALCPGALTGKLSDFAGLAFFPLLLLTLADATARIVRGKSALTHRVLVTCVLATGLVFGSAKATGTGAEALRLTFSALQWPVRAVAGHRHLPLLGRVDVVQDVTDLAALPALLIAYWVGRRTVRRADLYKENPSPSDLARRRCAG